MRGYMDPEKYKGFFDQLPVGAYVARPEGEVLAVNQAFASMLGYSSVDEVRKLTGWDFYVERADREKWLTRLDREGIVRNYEALFRKKNGKILWVKNSAVVTRGEDGEVDYFEGVVENFTSLHDLREVHVAHLMALRENDELYLQKLSRLPRLYVVRKDLDHLFTFANPLFCEDEAKRDLNELVGQTDFDIYPEETAKRYQSINERVLKSGKVFESTEEHRVADNEVRFVHVIRAPVHADDGRMSGLQILFWEETDQTTAMRELERTTYRAADYERLVQRHFGVVYQHDLEGHILSVNEAGEEMMGYTAAEFKQLSLNDVISKDHLNRVQPYLDRKSIDGLENAISTYEIDVVAKDNRRIPLEIVSRVLFREGRPFAIEGHARDITDRRREERERLKEIHHRVKNNLQYISSILMREGRRANDDELKRVLRECESRVMTMAFIHKQLYEEHDLDNIDIKDYVETLIQYLVNSYRRDDLVLNFQIKVDPELRLRLDAVVPCGLILNELISNAVKHGFPPKQRDRVEARKAMLWVGLHAEGDDAYRLYVSDNGDGIPREVDLRNTKSLGLRLVYGLVEEQLKGTIEINQSGGTRSGGTSVNIVVRNAK
jgi:PAS domain S-box-containing protein